MPPIDPTTAADSPAALPRGTRLGEFEVLRVLGIGGFGIVYLAFDHALEREVAVKEYMPSSLAGRTATLHVSLRSQTDADTFALGLKSFVNEARLLARFDHPSLLKVHRFWEANGTAYMAMPVFRGRNLKDERAAMAQAPDEAWMRRLLLPLLGAIATLHEAGVYHRDIAPDNILLEADGRPVLLDFGAARRVISDKSQTLTAILKPAYAPIEQYGEAGSVKQGPWTDLYALGATMHFMLLGRPPAPATARAIHDDHQPLSGQALPGCSEEFLRIVDWMLAPRPADRPQSVAMLRDALEGRIAAPVRVASAPAPSGWERTQVLETGAGTGAPRPPAAATPSTSRPAPATVPTPAPASRPVAAPMQPMPPVPKSGGTKLLPLLLGGVAVAAIGAYVFWPRPAAELPAAATAASAVEAPASVAQAVAPPVLATPQAASAPPPVLAAASEVELPAAPAARVATHHPTAAAVHPSAAGPVPTPGAAAPTPEPTPVAAAPALAVASAPQKAPESAVLPGPTSPREACGRRVLVALIVCMERECRRPEFRQHAECLKWRADQEQMAKPTN